MTQTVVETHNLKKVFGNAHEEVRALDGVTLSVAAGEFVAIVGPSGSGKSTLLNIIGALDRPSSGEISINGTPLAQVRDLDRFRSQTIGFVFQTHNLIPTLTAQENIEVPMYELTSSASRRRERAQELLRLVGLGQRMNYLPALMSGGERQRVAIARALANRPAIILADEPTGMLDSRTTQDILHLLTELNTHQGTTLMVVSHNHEVARATRRIITFRDGQIQSDVAIRSAFESDLVDWKSSTLGQAIVNGKPVPDTLRDIAPRLRQVLESV